MPDYKTVHDADTVAGSDTTAEIYIGGVKTNAAGVSTNVGLRKEQLSNQVATDGRVRQMDLDIAALQTTTPVPDDPTTILVSASVTPNRLVTNILITGYTGVGGAVTVNTTATPTATTWTGTAPTSYQTPSADWGVTETLRFWEVDSQGSWTEIKTETGVSGITIEYRDTIAPNPVTDLVLTDGTDAATQFTYEFSAVTDAQSGISGYRLINAVDNSIFLDPATAGSAQIVDANANPGDTIYFYVEAYDVAGNKTSPDTDSTNIESHTLSTSTVSDAGTASFTTSEYTSNESTNVINAVLQRTGGSSGTLQVTVSTRDRYDAQGEPLIRGGTAHSFGTTADVSTANDTIDLSTSSPGWDDQQAVTYGDDGGAVSIGLTSGNTYYVYDTGTDVYTLHTSQSDAATGANPVDLTASGAETQYIFEGDNVGYGSLDSVAYSWADTVTSNQNVPVLLVNLGMSLNNMFQIEIDHGSNTDGAASTVGAIGLDAALMLVESSSSAYTGFQQATSGLVTFSMENSNNSVTADSGDGTYTWNEIVDSRASGGAHMRPTSFKSAKGTSTTLDIAAAYIEVTLAINIAGSNTYDIFMRATRGGSDSWVRVHPVLLREISSITEAAGTATLTTVENHNLSTSDVVYLEGCTPSAYNDTLFTITVTGAKTLTFAIGGSPGNASVVGDLLDLNSLGLYSERWDVATCQPVATKWVEAWTHFIESACGDCQVTIPVPGSWTMRFYVQSSDFVADKGCLHLASVGYDPGSVGDNIFASDDNLGPDESTYATGTSPEDNEDNPTDAWAPIPTGVVTAPTLSPTNGATTVSTTTPIVATFGTNVTNIVVQTMDVTIGGARISGSARVVNNVVTFEWTGANLAENTTYTVTNVQGTCLEGGVAKALAFGTWSFTTFDSGGGNVLFSEDFSDAILKGLVDTRFTQDQLNSIIGTSCNTADQTEGGVYLTQDPLSTGRGTCFRQEYVGGQAGHGFQCTFPPHTG